MSQYYTKEHEWVSVEGGVATVGITDFAQQQLGDIVMIELPEVGDQLELESECVVIESVKAASEVKSPVSGTVTEVNEALTEQMELVNQSPEEEGWMYKIELDDPSQLDALLNEEQYRQLLAESEH